MPPWLANLCWPKKKHSNHSIPYRMIIPYYQPHINQILTISNHIINHSNHSNANLGFLMPLSIHKPDFSTVSAGPSTWPWWPAGDATAMAPEVAGEAMASPESGAGNHGKWWFHHGQWCDFTRENGDLTIEIGGLTKENGDLTRENGDLTKGNMVI